MAEPMYRQIADDLRRKIEAGELKRGGQLPTEIDRIRLTITVYPTDRNRFVINVSNAPPAATEDTV